MIIFSNWFGRLGNNLQQIENLICVALFYKHNILFKVSKHKFLNLKIIEEYFKKYNNPYIIKDRDFFFCSGFDKEVFTLNKQEAVNLLKQAFLIKEKDVIQSDIDDIVIHIRGGDIFNSNPHPKYVPPPLCYYTKILNNNYYKKIIIVAEDRKNPVINKLLSLYKNAIYNKNSLVKDIKIILGATNLINSIGTFAISLSMMSKYIKNIFTTNLYSKDLKEYYILNKPWKNTYKQRNYILTYKQPILK